MRRSQFSAQHKLSILLGLAVTLLLAAAAQAATHEKVLYRFTDGSDGAYPNSLILDDVGNIYGTAQWGGDLNCSNGWPNSGCGVVFELSPSGHGKWRERVLYAFQGGTDGIQPVGNLLFDSSNNLYGTTLGGGTDSSCNEPPGCGTVFELSPQGDGTWTETVLYSFQNGSDGSAPIGLTFDASGNLYGVTDMGGTVNSPRIYELSPPEKKGGAWTETTIYTMQNYSWAAPELLFDGGGNLYSTWFPNGCCGGVFELKYVDRNWQYTDLYDFQGGGNGGEPLSGVLFDNKGNMYGTGVSGGNDWGIAFELKRVRGEWTQIMLHNFCSLNKCADGAGPYAPLVFDQAGNLYGTTEVGGATCSADRDGCGVVFKLAPMKTGKWEETVLYSFQGGLDGYGPGYSVTLDGKGHIYGTTQMGGTSSGQGYGTVFEVTP
jgi:uncharacterized repeat protein (TIGR03803 family)